MRFASKDEAASFFRRLGMAPHGVLPGGRAPTRYKSVELFYESRLRTAPEVAAALARSQGAFKECMACACDLPWGDRSTEENPRKDWADYRRRRIAEGGTTSLYEAPTHVFEAGEGKKLERLIELALYMGWDAWIGVHSGGPIIQLSHDDYIGLHGRTRPSALVAELEKLGLRQPGQRKAN